jgi:hypothetical protein
MHHKFSCFVLFSPRMGNVLLTLKDKKLQLPATLRQEETWHQLMLAVLEGQWEMPLAWGPRRKTVVLFIRLGEDDE